MSSHGIFGCVIEDWVVQFPSQQAPFVCPHNLINDFCICSNPVSHGNLSVG